MITAVTGLTAKRDSANGPRSRPLPSSQLNVEAERPQASRSGTISSTVLEGFSAMSIPASEARTSLFPLIKKVNDDHDAIEIVSKHRNAVLVSADDYSALPEGAYLLRSPPNARRLPKSYENPLNC